MNNIMAIIKDCRIFDGSQFLDNCELLIRNGQCLSVAEHESNSSTPIIHAQGNIICLCFADLPVNGGGGLMFNDKPSVSALQTIASAHATLGTRCLLPTLITDTAEVTLAALKATKEAVEEGVPGIAGLHLEGPHLAVEKKGAHDATLIRRMHDEDLEVLLQAAHDLPVLKVTIAPESVSRAQVNTLVDAGVIVSLGHTNADYATCMEYFDAGASCATHLFNAMSQLASREPGLAGAAIKHPSCVAGVIADGIHVHSATLKTAWMAKKGMEPKGALGKLFLVTDAMAVAATSLDSFELQGRQIYRSHGRLELEDGTLAGADLSLLDAIRWLNDSLKIDLPEALAAAISIPRYVLYGNEHDCHISGKSVDDIICINADLKSVKSLQSVIDAA